MPEGNRLRKHSRAVVAMASVLVLGALFCYGLWTQSKSQLASDYRRHNYTSATYYPKYDACVEAVGKSKADCIAKAQNENRENERQERDLVAQETTAAWTLVMSGAAIFGVMLSIVGVWLVWATFGETKKANEIIRSDGRPWLDFRGIEFRKLEFQPGSFFNCTPKFTIQNFGKSPAFDVRMHLVVLEGKGTSFYDAVEIIMDNAWPSDTASGRTIFPSEIVPSSDGTMVSDVKSVQTPSDEKGSLWVTLGLTYLDGLGKAHGTFKTYHTKTEYIAADGVAAANHMSALAFFRHLT